jgi:hypothetical protein
MCLPIHSLRNGGKVVRNDDVSDAVGIHNFSAAKLRIR